MMRYFCTSVFCAKKDHYTFILVMKHLREIVTIANNITPRQCQCGTKKCSSFQFFWCILVKWKVGKDFDLFLGICNDLIIAFIIIINRRYLWQTFLCLSSVLQDRVLSVCAHDLHYLQYLCTKRAHISKKGTPQWFLTVDRDPQSGRKEMLRETRLLKNARKLIWNSN